MPQIKELIIKVVSGNASAQEVSQLTDWRNQSVENDNYYKGILNLWEKIGGAKEEITTDTNKAWENVYNKIHTGKKTNTFYLKIAAVVVLLISVGIVTKLFFLNPDNIKATEDDTLTENVTPENSHAKVNNVYASDSIKELMLNDSSLVILNSNSEISYKDFSENHTRLVNLKGEAYFDIIHKSEDFIVAAGSIKVKVIGTVFSVRSFRNDSIIEVVVEEGEVKAYEAKNTKNKIMLSAKEKGEYNTKTHEFTKSESTHKTKWWKGFFSRLKKIVDRLKHRKEEE